MESQYAEMDIYIVRCFIVDWKYVWTVSLLEIVNIFIRWTRDYITTSIDGLATTTLPSKPLFTQFFLQCQWVYDFLYGQSPQLIHLR